MPRSVSFAVILILLAAYPAAAQAPDSSAPAPPAPSQDSANSAQTKKPKKVWTNENLSSANGAASVVGDPKNNPKTESSKPLTAQYVAPVPKQLEKLHGQPPPPHNQLLKQPNS